MLGEIMVITQYALVQGTLILLKKNYLFLERGGGREKEKHQCVVASHMPPAGDLDRNPGMCSDWGLN